MDLFIVGLGNPGNEYVFTRHNAGFMIADLLQRSYDGVFKKHHSRTSLHAKITINGKTVHLIKPQTFMNRSGQAVGSLELEKDSTGAVKNLLVVFDDIHIPLGSIRYREGGSHGGHNGMRSIIDHIGTNQFHRLRVGVGIDKPVENMHNYVLGNFSKHEMDILSDTLVTAQESIVCYIDHGIQKAMNMFNSKVS
ncbi:MAG: aminoacyl-tRNA hydrolase [Candidatus Auribacterota bacterium]|jgi:PTH1 family peptidyl-tRNA hydrolase|nr:aminoacyl-tRNA hydrolase [Candidatus Auribacterota bacterium]